MRFPTEDGRDRRMPPADDEHTLRLAPEFFRLPVGSYDSTVRIHKDNHFSRGIAMKMTKRMKEDLLFLRKCYEILRKYWGKEGVARFAKIKTDLDQEVESMLGKPMPEVSAYITKSFLEWGWDAEKINQWFASKKSPFRNNVQLGEQELADVLVAELSLLKLTVTLQNNGMSFEDARPLVTATLMGGRPSYHQLINLLDGKKGRRL